MIQRLIPVVGVIFFLLLSGNVVGETSALMNIKSCVLVLGGTLISAFLAFSMKTIKNLIKSLRELFRHKETDHEGLIKQMENLARVGRLHGNRALENEVIKAENPFLRKGIELVVDGYDRYEIRNVMEKQFELYFSGKESQVNILNTLAKLAPVLGFVGTIMGLINVLNNIDATEEIGKGMALALLTTFYGLLFANFLFLPLAKKFSERIKDEVTLLNVILEGVMDISEQKNSMAISYRLQSYLSVGDLTRADGLESSSQAENRILRFPFKKLMARK